MKIESGELEEQKIRTAEALAISGRPLRSFDESLRTALEFLANPLKLWQFGNLEYKRVVLKLAFADRLIYSRKEGFRTAVLSLPFKVLELLSEAGKEMALPTGFEPVLQP